MQSQQSTAEQVFPRTYRVGVRTRHAINFLLFALSGLLVSIPLLALANASSGAASLRSIAFPCISGALLLTWLGSGYNKRVILHRDAIEVAGWFYSRRLNFAEIRGRRGAGGLAGAGYVYVLMPFEKGKRQLALPAFLHTDQIFRDWIKTIPKIPR